MIQEVTDLNAYSDFDRSLLAAVVSGSEDAIISKTLQSIVLSWNAAAERLFGWSAAEMIGQSILRIIPEELRYEEEQILAKLRMGERIERYETTRLRKDGSRVEISLTISPVRDAEGTIVGASKIAHDITERRRAERAMAALAEEGHIVETLNSVGESVASEFDLEMIVQRITDAATTLSGADFGAFFYNVMGKEGEESYWLYTISGVPREKFSAFPMPRSTQVFAPTFRGEGPLRSDDIRLDPRFGKNPPFNGMPEGHLPVVSYLAVPVKSKSGEVLGGIFLGHSEPGKFTARAERLISGIAAQAAIAIDISRLVQQLKERETRLNQLLAERDTLLESERAARSEAERLGHLKDEFLATLSHELRTPLHAVHGWTRVLLRGPRTPEQDNALQIIDRNVKAQSQIIDDLLDMSRIISGKTVLEVQSLELHNVVQAAIDTVKQTAEAKKIRLTALLDSTIGHVRGDPNRLQQAIWNLLTNAIKFTPSGGRVHVVLERVNSHVEISVEDSGIGIRPDFLPYVFDRFRQADASTTRSFGGLGLGLSIVKNLVELHGGQVRVRSRGENLGATFIVSLPVSHVNTPQARERAQSANPETPEEQLPSLQGARILVVDDEADGRDLIVRVLSDHGAECVAVDGARAALTQLDQRQFDILLSDVGMPEMDGYQLVREARAMERAKGRRLPAIAITAYARPEDRQQSLVAGYAAHLSKPVEPGELVATVAGLLRLMQ